MISDAEWRVMQVLWDRSPLTAGEVVESLADTCDWSPATVKTMLGRLVKKGVLAYEQDGKRYLYRPAVTREDAVKRESRSFLDRVFDGAAGAMLAHFVRGQKLTRRELNELRRLLEEKE